MRKLILKMHVSLDGFVAGPNNDMSWMQPDDEEEWDELFRAIENVDLFLLGGGMWEEYRDYWKKALTGDGFSAGETRYARLAAQTPHIVFSSSIKDAGWQNATIETGDLEQIVGRLKTAPGKDIQIVGGAALAASLIDSGLVDEYQIWVEPAIVGQGKSFFHNLKTRHRLTQQTVNKLQNGVVIITYTQLDSADALAVDAKKRRPENNK
jgi:dihydrofolate reductase